MSKCAGVECQQANAKMQCPKCKDLNISSFFCGQDCFRKSWSVHKATHTQANDVNMMKLAAALRQSGSAIGAGEPLEDGAYDPFPNHPYTGKLRPHYPLSPKSIVPDSITKPDYAKDGTLNFIKSTYG